ncbi:MAG: adenylate kinase family protein [Promethearchaeota archaeon]
MKVIVISGSPGTGKTTISKILKDLLKNSHLISINKFIKENELFSEYDDANSEMIVDEEKFKAGLLNHVNKLKTEGKFEFIIIEGILADLVAKESDLAIVLRLHPEILNERLENRDYSREKVLENIQSEVLGVCSSYIKNAVGSNFVDLDVTGKEPIEVAKIIINIINNNVPMDDFRPGKIDWIKADNVNLFKYFPSRID